jgi:hypothetical protein
MHSRLWGTVFAGVLRSYSVNREPSELDQNLQEPTGGETSSPLPPRQHRRADNGKPQMRADGAGLLKIGRTLGIGTGLVQRIVAGSSA